MKLSLSRKLSIALVLAFLVSILYAYLFSYILYERLYVKNVETELLDTGKRLAHSYEGGTVTEAFADKVREFGAYSKFDIFAVKNPRELSMCVPFEVDYAALIGGEERQQLLKGDPVFTKGYVERLNREVISAAIPLLDEQRLEGIIYLYYPLENMSAMTSRYTLYWLGGAVFFLMAALSIGMKWVKKTTKPLSEMRAAAREVSDGNLAIRVGVVNHNDDEISQLAKTFNEMAESIQQEDEQRKEFLANVSHELRTPLSYIKGYMEAIQSGIVAPENTSTYQQIILRESSRMERLVNDLFDLAKLESKEFSLQKSPISLAQTIEESLGKIRQRTDEKGITLEQHLDYELIVDADEERLSQLLLNVLDNAITYTDQGGTITVSLVRHQGMGRISIADTGRGIPKEDIEKITQRFYRVQKARTRNEGGTGLGLAIVEKLTKLHGGVMSISSESGMGTEIQVRLPLLVDAE